MKEDPPFPIFDEPVAPTDPRIPASYALPPEDWDRMVNLANHLAKREAEMPLRRRIASYLETKAWTSPEIYTEDPSSKARRESHLQKNVERLTRRIVDRLKKAPPES